MFYTVYYSSMGNPVNNLNPVIKIREIESGNIVASGVMISLGGGLYTYDFPSYDLREEHMVVCDAMTHSVDERYKFLASGEYGDLLNTVAILNDNIELRTLLIKKILTNKLELQDGDVNNWILYDDDNLTELLKWDVKDKENNKIIERSNTNSRRSKAR